MLGLTIFIVIAVAYVAVYGRRLDKRRARTQPKPQPKWISFVQTTRQRPETIQLGVTATEPRGERVIHAFQAGDPSNVVIGIELDLKEYKFGKNEYELDPTLMYIDHIKGDA